MKNKKIKFFKKSAAGFTLIEILVVIGIIAILAAVVLIAINPARQFAQTRDSQRSSNLNAILNAIGQRMADNKGVFNGTYTVGTTNYTCPTLAQGADDTAAVTITADNVGSGGLACLVPTYLTALPVDPSGPTAPDTGYKYYQETGTGRIHVLAPVQEPTISRTTPIKISR